MAVLRGPDHVFEITNAGYLQLIGHRDVIGKPVREALPEIDGQGFFELLDEVYSTRRGVCRHGACRADPAASRVRRLEERFLDFVYQPMRDADGAVSGIFVQGHDITDQKLAEIAAAQQRGALPAAGAIDAQPRLDGAAGRQSRLVQRPGLCL